MEETLNDTLKELVKEVALIRKSMETMSYDLSHISNLMNLSA